MSTPLPVRSDVLRSRELFTLRILVVLAVALALLALGGLTLRAGGVTGAGAASGYQIGSSVSHAAVRPGDEVRFTIRITNTGATWITTLPLRDVYTPTYLAYGACGARQTAAPWPEDYADDGQLDWSDLTAAAPYGFGTDLAPGAGFTIIVTFTAAADTSILPAGAAENRAIVHGAVADPDVLLPEQTSAAVVGIFTPTCAAGPSRGAWPAFPGSPLLRPTCQASIGGQVWRDVNFDGDMVGEWDLGIDGALITAYWDDGDDTFEPGAGDPVYRSAVTGPPAGSVSGHGAYDFPLPPPSICGSDPSGLWVAIDGSSFDPGGALGDMVLTSENTYFPLPALVWLDDWYVSLDYVSFGFNVAGSYTLAALGTQPASQRVGQPINVSFRITNTGPGWLAPLPFKSSYDPAYLAFAAASPPPDDAANAGELAWHDLTGGPAAPLPPGHGVTIVITFTGVTDTSPLPGGTATVAAASAGVFADPDGPGSPLPALGPLRTREATQTVEILRPTGLTLSQLGAAAVEAGVLLTWQTESEADILGFNVLRRDQSDGELEVVNPELILAEHAGGDRGARYAYLDGRALPGVTGRYVLEVVLLDGRTEQHRMPDGR